MGSIRKVICGTCCRASRGIRSTVLKNCYRGISLKNYVSLLDGAPKSDSCITPSRSICRIQREPRQLSSSGEGSTIPEATRSSRFPCSSASSSNTVRTIPLRKFTTIPWASTHVSSCDRQSISPNNPLKSARTRIVFDSAKKLTPRFVSTIITVISNRSYLQCADTATI